jgi:diaminopimelate epimerase
VTGRLLKVEAAGNDFLLGVGSWAGRLADEAELTVRLCDRRRGIGADGVLAVERTAASRARLRYRNADGSAARFCGNGSRCAARAAVELLGLPRRLILDTDWVAIPAEVDGATVTLELPPQPAPARAVELALAGRRWSGWWLEVGVPHLVLPVDDLAAVDPARAAPPLRRHPELGPDGANVDFVARLAPGEIGLRTYERGVEAEVLCCGSGVVAAALVEMACGDARRVIVLPRSGDELVVEVTRDPLADPVRFTGPTRFVAEIEPTAELLKELDVED